MIDSQEIQNENKIVKMKLDKDFLTFDAKHYSKKLINYISKEEWRNIAFDATQVIFDAYSYSKQQSIIIVPSWMESYIGGITPGRFYENQMPYIGYNMPHFFSYSHAEVVANIDFRWQIAPKDYISFTVA
jgi:hypothetical protein